MSVNLKLYLVTDRDIAGDRDIVELIEEAVRGGVTVVQLREKHASTREFLDLAIRVKTMLNKYGVPLIINDRVDIVLASGADGLHIGQSDMPYSTARELLGYQKIIGLSVETVEEAVAAEQLDVDYIAISPIFSTKTKQDIKEPFELVGARECREVSNHPIVAIGGINLDNCSDVISLGIDGVAVISAILGSSSPYCAARSFKEKLEEL